MSTLKELKAMGGFVPDKPISKEIKFTLDDATEYSAIIHVKKMNIGEYEALFLTDKEEKSRTAKIISVGVFLGEDGKERIPFDEAYKLHPSLAGAMVTAFHEVNIPKKVSRPKTDSSAT